jgi:hypothetical protein
VSRGYLAGIEACGKMIDEWEIPTSLVERAMSMENLMVAHATGGMGDGPLYERLRREFMADDALKPLLPDFVRTCRSLSAFWGYIKNKGGDLRRAPPDYQHGIRAANRSSGTAALCAGGCGCF